MSDKDYHKNYYQSNKDKLKDRTSIWRKLNPKRNALYQRNYNNRIRLAILSVLGNKCCRCGFSDTRALQIDHVKGDGCRKKHGTGPSKYLLMLGEILEGSEDYQLLCANCNWIKRVENNETGRKYF